MPKRPPCDTLEAVIFDLDGVLLDSETVWDDARRELVARAGGTWESDATREMMGMSSPEWSAYLRDRFGVPLSAEQISAAVVESVEQRYAERLPLVAGSREAVVRVSECWPVGLASSSNRAVIERFLDASGLRPRFTATVSSEEVGRGKPAPDVYLAAAAHLGAAAERCVAIEDSTNGIRAAAAAQMNVVAVPNRHFPPTPDALAAAVVVLTDLASLTPELIGEAARP
jgi:HAD superfamily hydrolase (TIGR01509 family)